MAVTLDTQSATTVRKTYTYAGPPNVQVTLSLDQATSSGGMSIRISGASGPAQLNNVLQIIMNKISADFGV